MKYSDLTPVRDLLNKKFKGKPLPNTDYTVRDFVILPNKMLDAKTYARTKYALDINVPVGDIEKAINDNPHLEIRVRLNNKDMKEVYDVEELGFTIRMLEQYTFA